MKLICFYLALYVAQYFGKPQVLKAAIENINDVFMTLWQPFHVLQPWASSPCQLFSAVVPCSPFITSINQQHLTTNGYFHAVERSPCMLHCGPRVSAVLLVCLKDWNRSKEG